MSPTSPRDLLPGKIETERLILRQPIRGDVPALVALADNRKIADMLARLPHPYTRADGIAFVEIMAISANERPYAITLKKDGTLIGIIGFSFEDGHPPELGYWLGEPHWGRGFASEAAKGLIAAADATKAFPVIAAWAKAHNHGSIGVLTKAGLKKTATPKKRAPSKDKSVPLVSFLREARP